MQIFYGFREVTYQASNKTLGKVLIQFDVHGDF